LIFLSQGCKVELQFSAKITKNINDIFSALPTCLSWQGFCITYLMSFSAYGWGPGGKGKNFKVSI
jgi:hypothetical protein